ncbi:MAG: derlin [archaeon]|nr:derlin [archaeon]
MNTIIAFLGGHIYFFLKDIAPVQNKVDILKTPKFVVDFSEKHVYPNILTDENRRQQGFEVLNLRERGNANNGGNAAPNNQQRGGYVPFGGRGHRLDE